MKVFNYNEQGYFIGISELDESDKCQITLIWLIPAMATEKEPLEEKDGFEVKFQNGDWQYIKLLSIEEKKIKGELSLEDGEIIQDDKLVKLEKPSKLHYWNGIEWILNVELKKQQILNELDKIDLQSIRPNRNINIGLGTDFDKNKLIELEEKAKKLRLELSLI